MKFSQCDITNHYVAKTGGLNMHNNTTPRIPRDPALHPCAVLFSLIGMTAAVLGVLALVHKIVTGVW